jgi:hypothetical protein
VVGARGPIGSGTGGWTRGFLAAVDAVAGANRAGVRSVAVKWAPDGAGLARDSKKGGKKNKKKQKKNRNFQARRDPRVTGSRRSQATRKSLAMERKRDRGGLTTAEGAIRLDADFVLTLVRRMLEQRTALAFSPRNSFSLSFS